jgi:outer membrane protein
MQTHPIVRFVIRVCSAVLLATATASAQDPLSLDEAIARALRQNPSIRSAQATERESVERMRQARAGWLPRVDVTESWQRGNQPVFVFGSLLAQRRFTADNFQIDMLNHPDAVSNYRTGIAIEQSLFDGKRTSSAVRAASLGREIADAGARDVVSSLKVGVTQAYGQGLMAEAQRRAAASAVAAAEEDVRRAERRRDAGMGTEADVLALNVHLALVLERQIVAASQETISRARLNEVMGEPLDHAFQLQAAQPQAAEVPSLNDLEAEALKSRPDVFRATTQERLTREAVTTARAGYYPQAAVQGVYEFNGNTLTNRASSWTVGAVVRWNVFGGLADAARVGEARAANDRARADRERQETAVRVDVRVAVARVEESRAREVVGRSAQAQAKESQRMVRDRYEAGLATVNDLLRAANAVLDAESQHTAALVDVLVSAAMLERARGR